MTEQEKLDFEHEIRDRIAEENRAKQRAYKAKWREQNREHLREYERLRRLRNKSKETVYRKAVCIVDHNGTILKTFPSAMEASRMTGVDTSSIAKCCKGLLKTAGDFIWRYRNGTN